MDFIYDANPSRVIFAAGARLRVGAELDRLGIARAIVITTPPKADIAADIRAADRRARRHRLSGRADAYADQRHRSRADGGLLGPGRRHSGDRRRLGDRPVEGDRAAHRPAAGRRADAPSAGSEMTPMLGETERGVKLTQRSPKMLPETVIYDPDLRRDAAAFHVAGPSAMNAIAQCGRGALCRGCQSADVADGGRRDPRAWRAPCPVSSATTATLPPGPTRFTARGLAGSCVRHGRQSRCMTRSATRWAARSISTSRFALRDAALHSGLQPRRRTRGHAPRGTRARRRAMAPGALYDLMLEAATSDQPEADGTDEGRARKGGRSHRPRIHTTIRDPSTRDDVLAMLVAAYEGERP